MQPKHDHLIQEIAANRHVISCFLFGRDRKIALDMHRSLPPEEVKEAILDMLEFKASMLSVVAVTKNTTIPLLKELV